MSKSAIGFSHAVPPPTSPLVFKPKSAWAKGPPRSLSTKSDTSTNSSGLNSSGVADGATGVIDSGTGGGIATPISLESASPTTLITSGAPAEDTTTDTKDMQTTNPSKEATENPNLDSTTPSNVATSPSTAEPPPRPKRNPLRRESSAGFPSDPISPLTQPGQSSATSSASVTPTQSALPSASSQATSTMAPTTWSSFLAQSKTIPPAPADLPPIPKEHKSRSRSRRRDQVDEVVPVNTMTLSLPPVPSYPPPLPPAPPSSSSTTAPLVIKSKLQVDAQPFVPAPAPALPTPTSAWPTPTLSRRSSAAIVIKNSKGEEVDIRKLSNLVTPAGKTAPSSAVFSVPAAKEVKLESEEERNSRLAEEKEGQSILNGTTTENELPVTSPSTNDESSSTDIAPQSSSHDDISQSQESALDEEDEDWSAQSLPIPIPTLATSPPTAGLDSAFPTSLSSVVNPASAGGNPNAPPLTRPRRERSRRGSKRGDSANRQGAVGAVAIGAEGSAPSGAVAGLNAMTRTRSGGLTRTRSNAGETMTRTRSSTGEARTRTNTNPIVGIGVGEALSRTRSGEGMTRTRSSEPRRRPAPGRLDLSGLPKPSAVGASTGVVAGALANARMIVDLGAVVYPEGVSAPSKELNEGVEDAKFRYDREFLLQFRGYCTERPVGMEEHEEITLEQPIEQPVPTSTRSTRRRRSVRSNAEPMLPTPIMTAGVGSTLGIPGTPGMATMPLTAEDQLAVGTIPATPLSATLPPVSMNMGRTGSRGGRSRNGSNAAKLASINGTNSTGLPPPFPMIRSTSHGSSRNTTASTSTVSGLPPPSPLDRHSRSLKSRKRSASTRNEPPLPSSHNLHDDVKPLEISANRWTPSSISSTKQGPSVRPTVLDAPIESEEVVEKKIKGLLNKLTLEKFDSISDQIVSWANKSEQETDGRTLQLVIRWVFDKATDESAWSAMYARLCKKMMERVSAEVSDENIKDRKGDLIVGGQLFRQYLLSRCQADFEKGWSTRETLEEQQSAVVAAQGSAPGELVFSDEYYALQKAKRRGLGLVKFIGELFNLDMLTERIMHRCILKLLDEPAEDDIESVCQLLKTVGVALGGSKGKESMGMYFGRMKELSENQEISQRIRFMLLDVIDLRSKGWISKKQDAAPSTLAQVHEAAAKEANERSITSKPIPIARNSSRRGQNRSDTSSQKDADGWLSTGPSTRSLSKATGTSGLVTAGSHSKMEESIKSPNAAKSVSSSSGGFHSLARLPSEPGSSRMTRQPSEPGKSRSKRGGEGRQVNRRTSVDFAHLDAVVDAGSSGRKRLQLLPRTVPTVGSDPTEEDGSVVPPSALGATFEEPPSMSDEQARAKVDEDIKEFMQIRDLDEAAGYFESLPSEYRYILVDKFVTKMDSKESDLALIGELFDRVAISGVCSAEVFEQGFAPTVEALDDISLDVPAAYSVMARLLRASKLSREVVDRLAGTINIYEQVLVHPRDKLMREFDGTS